MAAYNIMILCGDEIHGKSRWIDQTDGDANPFTAVITRRCWVSGIRPEPGSARSATSWDH